MPFYWRPRNYRRNTYIRNTWRWKGGRVMARRASRPATPFAISETMEPETKALWSVEDYAERPRYLAPPRTNRSSIVKLTYNYQIALMSPNSSSVMQALPLTLNLNNVPGFSDYQTVYSEYRILRGVLSLPTLATTDQFATVNNYLVVSSQPFALTSAPLTPTTETSAYNYVPPQLENALRQARWQRVVYPDSTRTAVNIGFYPYTMVATDGPDNGTTKYQRIWSGRRWTPFTWSTSPSVAYFGPYVWRQSTSTDSTGTEAWQPYVTVTLYCIFKGQK